MIGWKGAQARSSHRIAGTGLSWPKLRVSTVLPRWPGQQSYVWWINRTSSHSCICHKYIACTLCIMSYICVFMPKMCVHVFFFLYWFGSLFLWAASYCHPLFCSWAHNTLQWPDLCRSVLLSLQYYFSYHHTLLSYRYLAAFWTSWTIHLLGRYFQWKFFVCLK